MLGVCYYPEHWDETRWAEDARRMVELGILRASAIRPVPANPRATHLVAGSTGRWIS